MYTTGKNPDTLDLTILPFLEINFTILTNLNSKSYHFWKYVYKLDNLGGTIVIIPSHQLYNTD